ncbi:ABC transporter substrate-binding protein [Pontibacter silvestris]|nr:ABC transporter substrate-binding protein [Pontibacter silvestris]MCC9137743.1 ABC transporter substrate-binding protein [Pontibacter silvestris]
MAGIIVAGTLALPVQAQQSNEVQYRNGKTLMEQQRYDLAMNELLPLTNASPDNAYAPEASYFYSLAALKANKLQEAYQMLVQLQNQHAQWSGMPEADYLLANVLFEQGEYDHALSKLQELKGSALESDAESLKRYYLNRLTDRTTYELLLERYWNDKTIAQVYADKLLGGWYKKQDRQTLENIVTRFNLDRSRYLSKDAFNNLGFNVAVLLPFQLNQDLMQTARKNQFVTDLYAGMQLAQDSLLTQGIQVKLFSYDVGADTSSTKRILNLPEIKQMDLIIGPVYKSTAKVAARFATENNVTVINPLSQDAQMASSENVFLFESSVATQARQAAAYAYQNFSPKTAVILYENTKDDTTFAYHYRQQYIKLGGKVKVYKKISSNEASVTAQTFKDLKLEEVGHMAVFSDKMTAAVNATSLLQSKSRMLPLLTYEKWLDINQITLRQLDDLEVYFVSPKYFNKLNPANNWFRKQYISKYNLPPSVYAYSGFEMLYYFGMALQNYGANFNQALPAAGVQPGVFYPGIGYNDTSMRNEMHQDNQYVPITKLENLQLTVVNPIF